MKLSSVLTIGATAALAAGANAAILILDNFTGAPTSISIFAVGTSPPDYQVAAPSGVIRESSVTITAVTAGAPSAILNATPIPPARLDFATSYSANGYCTLTYGDFGDMSNPELNLDRSMFGIAGGIGLYLRDWSSDFLTPLNVKIYSGNAANWWEYNTVLPLSIVGDLIVDGTSFVVGGGAPVLTDVDSIVYKFDPPAKGDFTVGALGIPEPHEYAMMAGLGLLGFAAWRRLQKKA